MISFTYTAVDSKENYVKGRIEAPNEQRARKKLEQEGFLIVNIQKEQKTKTQKLSRFFVDVSRLDKIFFTRHLHTMLESGMALDEAIKITAEQTTNETFRQILTDIHYRLQKGEALHTSLGRHPKYFNNFFISFIKVGEKSGKLDDVLAYLLEQQEKDYDLITQARSAMIYPSIILSAMVGIVVLMMVFVIPKVAGILNEYNVELPLATKILIGISNFIVHWGFIALPVLIILILLLRKWSKSKKGKPKWDSFLLSIPRLNNILKEFNLARFSRSMHSLLKSGISIDYALDLTSEISNNSLYQNASKDAMMFVRKGVSMGEILKGKGKLFPPIATRMIEVGERSGTLDHMLGRIAIFYEKSVTRTVGNLASIIEPVLLLSIGFSVGFVAISILTPIWKFSDTIG